MLGTFFVRLYEFFFGQHTTRNYKQLRNSNGNRLRNDKSLLLLKGEPTVELVDHSFLREYIDFGWSHMYDIYDMKMHIHFAVNHDNYHLYDRSLVDPCYFIDDHVFMSSTLFRNVLFYNISSRIILPHVVVDGVHKVSINEEAHEHNRKVCLFVMESIYGWAFKKLAIEVYYNFEKAKDDVENEDKVEDKVISKALEKIKGVFMTLFVLQPTVGKYIMDFIEDKDHGNERLKGIARKGQELLIRNICTRGIRIEGEIDKTNKDLHSFLEDYKQLQEAVLRVLDYDKNCMDDYRQPEDSTKEKQNAKLKVLQDFLKLNNKIIERVPKDNAELSGAIRTCKENLYLLDKVYFSKISQEVIGEDNLLQFYDNINDSYLKAGDAFKENNEIATKIFKTVKDEFCRVKREMGNVEWCAGMINNNYMWETAKMIGEASDKSEAIVKTIFGKTSYGNSRNLFITTYRPGFPALLKSICDLKPELEMKMSKNLSLSKAMDQIINAREWEIEHFLNLYWTVMKIGKKKEFKSEKERKEEEKREEKERSLVNKYLLMLGEKIKKEEVVKGVYFIVQASRKAIRLMYAIHILFYCPLVNKSESQDLTENFRIAIYVETMLSKYVDGLSFREDFYCY